MISSSLFLGLLVLRFLKSFLLYFPPLLFLSEKFTLLYLVALFIYIYFFFCSHFFDFQELCMDPAFSNLVLV